MSPHVQPLLEVRDLHVAYGKIEALHGIDLRVAPGSIVTVIGPNGAGKSTLLSAIIGLLPSRGELRLAGQRIPHADVEHMVGAGVALVPESRELFTTMNVEDNLLLGAVLRYRSGKRDQRDTLEHVYTLFPRLRERRTQLAATLSGGERQMLALGRALMARPRLLLLDEPSLGLAPLVTREIFRIITRLRATGVAILLVEQNARAALAVADHAYVLETGEVVLQGPAGALRDDPRVIATYLGVGGAHQDRLAS